MVQGTIFNIAQFFQNYAISDFLLPFLLVFAIIFAVMQKTKLLGDKKNIHVMISLILGLLFVIPHINGQYPLGYDPVQILNSTLPSISLVAVAAIMLLILMGIFGTKMTQSFAPVIAFAAIGFVVYIFGTALNLWNGPWATWSWFTTETTELIIILLIFGVVVWLITKEPADKTAGKDMLKGVKDWFTKD